MWTYDKNKTGILLEIILNISKCLTAPLSRKISFYGNSIIFLLRLMHFVNLQRCQMCIFYCLRGLLYTFNSNKLVCYYITMPGVLLNWEQSKEFNCFMILIIRPGNTLQIDFFRCNECLRAIFSLLIFWNFELYILVMVLCICYVNRSLLVLRYRWF